MLNDIMIEQLLHALIRPRLCSLLYQHYRVRQEGIIFARASTGHIEYTNTYVLDNLGWSQKELGEKPFIEFVHPKDRERTIAKASRMKEGEAATLFTNLYICKDESYKAVHWNAIIVGGWYLCNVTIEEV